MRGSAVALGFAAAGRVPGDAFVEWFDSLSLSELDRLLADRSVKGAREAPAT